MSLGREGFNVDHAATIGRSCLYPSLIEIKFPSQAAPDFCSLAIARAEAPVVAARRAETGAIAEPHFLQPAITVELDAHLRRIPAGIGVCKRLPDAACREVIFAADPVIIGNAQAFPKDASDGEIGFGFPRHATAMLGPLPGHQAGTWHHTHIAPRDLRGDARSRRTPLRPGPAALRPQAMHNQAKSPMIAGTLHAVIAAVLPRPAKGWRPAECERVAGNRDIARTLIGGDLRHGGDLRRAALISLGLNDSRKACCGDCQPKFGTTSHAFLPLF